MRLPAIRDDFAEVNGTNVNQIRHEKEAGLSQLCRDGLRLRPTLWPTEPGKSHS